VAGAKGASQVLSSIKVFLFAALVIVLQIIPYTGIFLMLVGAAYWSVILVNLGFGLLAIEAATKRAPYWAGIFPLLWFGGYTAASITSHAQAKDFIAKIDQANQGLESDFDSTKYEVLVRRNSDIHAAELVEHYGLPRVFSEEGRNYVERTRSVWIVENDCPGSMGAGVSRFGPGHEDDVVWNRVTMGGYGTGERIRSVPGVCVYYGVRTPEKPVFSITTGTLIVGKGVLQTEAQDIVVQEPSGAELHLSAGFASPLSWLPKPIAGCALNSGAAKWQCTFEFIRESRFENPYLFRSPEQVVARGLGLKLQKLGN
jgi:hypothetical protein